MNDKDCIAFLQRTLPRVGLAWPGFRKVRRTVCKRIARRVRALGLADLATYGDRLENDAEERRTFASLCRIPISRFYRDRAVFDRLADTVLPALAKAAPGRALRCWSAGCASGEEPYTVAILWKLRLAPRFPDRCLSLLATDAEPRMLERARRGCYDASSLRSMPREWLERAFVERDGLYCVAGAFRNVEFVEQDLRETMPDGPFDLVLCRNLVLTYFAADAAHDALQAIISRIRPGGALVVGIHESLPAGAEGAHPWPRTRAIFRRD